MKTVDVVGPAGAIAVPEDLVEAYLASGYRRRGEPATQSQEAGAPADAADQATPVAAPSAAGEKPAEGEATKA